jgi:hypothetical protein
MSINQREVALLTKLKAEGLMLASAWPSGLADLLEQLRRGGIVKVAIPAGRRGQHIVVTKADAIEKRLAAITYQDIVTTESTRAINILENGGSKRGAKLPYISLMLVGGSAVGWETEQGVPVSWPKPSHPSCLRLLNVDERAPEQLMQPLGDVILVENKDLAINLPEILPERLKGALIVHYEGWLSERLLTVLKRWRYASLWILPDMDPVGFANIKRLRDALPTACVLLPIINKHDLKLFKDEAIWNDNVGLVGGLLPWLETQSRPLQEAFDQLHKACAGIEQEALLVLGKNVVWELDKPVP